MDNIRIALLADISVLSLCTFLLLRHGRLGHSHPATTYLFFHIYVFTFRLLVLSVGAPTLFRGWVGSLNPITYNEILRAAAIGDLALIMFVAGSIRASFVDLRNRPKALHLGKDFQSNM